MAFSEEIIEYAWRRAGGRCECRRIPHKHSYGRCGKNLVHVNQGRKEGRGHGKHIILIHQVEMD